MKRCFKFSAIIMVALISIFTIDMEAANQPGYVTVSVQKQVGGYTHYQPDVDETGKRSSSRKVQCMISEDSGVDISGCDDTILSYEIWDAEGEICLGSYSEESDFIDGLFSMSGELQVRFLTEEYTYIGVLSM